MLLCRRNNNQIAMQTLFTPLYRSAFRNTLFALCGLPLLAALAWPMPSVLATGLIGLHIGLFIIWHPFWLGQSNLPKSSSCALLALGLLIALSQSLVLLCAWLIILASLLAGEPMKKRRDIGAQGLAILFLLCCLFVYALPSSFNLTVSVWVERNVAYFLMGLLTLLALLKQQQSHQSIRQTDLLLSLIFSQIVTTTALGTALFVLFKDAHYISALLMSTSGVAVFLILVNWSWKLFTGTTALSFLWNRYLLILGSPFENLLVKFSALAKTTQSPGQYLDICYAELIKLEWLTGIRWRAASGQGELGQESPHLLEIEIADLTVQLYGSQALRDSLAVHARLLIHMITHFYHSIKRERSLAHRAHVQALYETGARLTHDIKNLLQGMKTLSAAGESTSDPVAFHALFVKQIPTINERLETTLRKLTEPNKQRKDRGVTTQQWWQNLQQRYQGRDINMEAQIDIDRQIPAEMFDTISENLLENARTKRLHERNIEIQAQLISNSDGIVFSVNDNGYAVPADKAKYLLGEPVRSDQGLGVGLYQSAALAKHQGYELQLETNLEGMVCFTLAERRSSH